MICCLASADCPLRDTAAPLAACGGREGIRAVYDAGIDLGHYGEVDQLAPAGAMAEFTAYVSRQSEEEAEAADLNLNVLHQALSNCQELVQEGCGDLGTQALIKFYEQ